MASKYAEVAQDPHLLTLMNTVLPHYDVERRKLELMLRDVWVIEYHGSTAAGRKTHLLECGYGLSTDVTEEAVQRHYSGAMAQMACRTLSPYGATNRKQRENLGVPYRANGAVVTCEKCARTFRGYVVERAREGERAFYSTEGYRTQMRELADRLAVKLHEDMQVEFMVHLWIYRSGVRSEPFVVALRERLMADWRDKAGEFAAVMAGRGEPAPA
jgi:hypothetical protein